MVIKNNFINNDAIIDYLNKNNVDSTDKVLTDMSKTIHDIILKYKRYSKSSNSNYNAKKVKLTKSQIENLPKWLKDNVNEISLIGKNTLIIPDGRKYQLNNSLNHLSSNAWTYFTSSVFFTNYKTTGPDNYAFNIRKIHPSPKPPPLMRDIIEFFTKENDIILDYFMGVGGSLLGASLCNRRSIGIDLNDKYINAYKQAAINLKLPLGFTMHGDALDILSEKEKINNILKNEKLSLILIDPPYSNMMSKKKTGADISRYGNVSTPFTNDTRDLGNLSQIDFFKQLKLSVELSEKFLKKKGYIVIFIKDLQPHGKETNLLHSEIIKYINEIPNIEYKGLKIWADQTAKLFPYGYPFSFVANQIHQYILVFRKEY